MAKLLELFFRSIKNSENLDEMLGFGVREIETKLLERAREFHPFGDMQSWGSVLHQGNQTWVGLALETLQTPYEEVKRMCDLLCPLPGEKVVDLGAGYGRLGLVLKLFYPEVEFLGFEYVIERVEAGNRVLQELDCKHASLFQQDLTRSEFKMPEADFYFIYDYGKVEHIRHTLNQLDEMANRKTFKVVARGKGTRSLIEKEHPWLSQVHPPHHEEKFSIYSMSF